MHGLQVRIPHAGDKTETETSSALVRTRHQDAPVEHVLDAVRAGDQHLSCELLAGATDATGLTEREPDCLRPTAGGDTAKQIARDLHITERTVRFHLANVYRKLGVQRRSQAVAVAYERRIL